MLARYHSGGCEPVAQGRGRSANCAGRSAGNSGRLRATRARARGGTSRGPRPQPRTQSAPSAHCDAASARPCGFARRWPTSRMREPQRLVCAHSASSRNLNCEVLRCAVRRARAAAAHAQACKCAYHAKRRNHSSHVAGGALCAAVIRFASTAPSHGAAQQAPGEGFQGERGALEARTGCCRDARQRHLPGARRTG